MVLEFLKPILDPILNELGINGGSDSTCDSKNTEPHMISQYQCDVHKKHIGEDQDAVLPEFVAGGNSMFDVTANDLKARMACCDSNEVRQLVESALSADDDASKFQFLPFCCKTTQSKCPGMYNVDFSYTNQKKPFNGVCYAEGYLVNQVITPTDPDREEQPSKKRDQTGAMISIVIITFIVCIIVYLNIKKQWSRQKRDRLRKRLVKGLESIDQVVQK